GGKLRHLWHRGSRLRRLLAPGFLRLTGARRGLYVSDDATPATRACIRTAKGIFRERRRPLFVFINLMQAHYAYRPPPETKGRFGSVRSWPTLPDSEVCFTLAHGFGKPCRARDLEQLQAVYDEEVLFQDRMLGNL